MSDHSWQEYSDQIKGACLAQRQHKAGKQTARERLDAILDEDSFEELDMLALSPHLSKPAYTDGVIAGFGTIMGKKVAIYLQDFTIKGGSLGQRHAEKICKVMDLAIKVGCPIIGVVDSGGARIDEGIHALNGYGEVFRRNVRYSGVVPQISLILGPCAGGAAYSPALTDIVFMVEGVSNMFITGPQVIKQAIHQDIDKESLGGATVHGQVSGVAHVIAQTEAECIQKLKELLQVLPDNYLNARQQDLDSTIPADDLLAAAVPTNMQQAYDIKLVIQQLVDTTFFELQASFASNIVVGFATIGGLSVGIVANQPRVRAGTLDIDASCKAARFINFCDSFEIPLVTLVDIPGFLPGVDQEHNGIIRHGAKLLYAYARATVPKITVILRKAFGGAYIVMGSKSLGADVTFAWPSSQIAVLGAREAVAILHRRELSEMSEDMVQEKKNGYEKAYEEDYLNPLVAAQSGYIDAIIEPSLTKQHIVRSLHFMQNKVEVLPKKKHGNIPL